MRLKDVAKELNLTIVTADKSPDTEVRAGYSSDLLSDVMANSQEGSLWITLQIHANIVAVASMKDISGIILVNGRKPEPETVKKANEEKINIFVSDLPAFEIAGRLYKMGIKGVLR